MDLRPGQRLDHYTLLEPLGEGGQGSVWKVLDPRDGGVMRALKIVSLAETGPAAFERAQREARILAAANHAALITCHGLFEDPRAGLVGLLMDLVEGRTLADVVARERLDDAHFEAVIAQVADALAYIHDRGLAHRDLKPENVLVTDRFRTEPNAPGAIKLVDFGIAAPASNAHKLTATGLVIGTLPYLAPEMVDPASWGPPSGIARDVFAFGVMAFQLRFGKHPTGLGPGATMIDYARAYKAAEAKRIAWPPAGLTDRTGSAIALCLALRAGQRPANGAAIVAALQGGAPPRQEVWSGSFGPTSPHPELGTRGGPPAFASTAATSPPLVRRDETIAAAPVPAAFQQPPWPGAAAGSPDGRSAKRGCSLTLAVVLGALGMLLVLAAAAFVAGWPPSTPIARPTPVVAPTPIPRPPEAPPAQMVTDYGSCCRSEAQCQRSLTRFACPICTTKPPRLPRNVSWKMRFAGIDPNLRADHVCAWLQASPDARICVPVALIPDATGAGGRLAVSLDDVEYRRIVFAAYRGGVEIARGLGYRRDESPYLASALCMGFALNIDGPGGQAVPVRVYLDDH